MQQVHAARPFFRSLSNGALVCKYRSMNEFASLGLGGELAQAFLNLGFSQPTRVQSMAIPKILLKKDLFIQSETGTGKTFAYAAPALSAIRGKDASNGPLILVVCPTQELAVQVAKQIEALLDAAHLSMNVLSLLGGSPLSRQESALKKKPHIVIGTPGRTSDLVRMRLLHPKNLEYLVLDEADRLFSSEYREATESILEAIPANSARILASATISEKTKKVAGAFMNSPESLDLLFEGVLSRDIEHWVFYVEHRRRIDFIRKLESAIHPSKCLIFASSSDRVFKTAQRLAELGLPVDSILSRQEKEHRRVAIERFARGGLRYLVTSDLGARGLDIPAISHVISLDFPEESSWYIHRAGRTARAGEKGISIVLADAWELRSASKIAVERKFVFRTKALESGNVIEPPVEDFFALVEKGEEEKQEYRRKKYSDEKRK